MLYFVVALAAGAVGGFVVHYFGGMDVDEVELRVRALEESCMDEAARPLDS